MVGVPTSETCAAQIRDFMKGFFKCDGAALDAANLEHHFQTVEFISVVCDLEKTMLAAGYGDTPPVQHRHVELLNLRFTLLEDAYDLSNGEEEPDSDDGAADMLDKWFKLMDREQKIESAQVTS